MQSFPHKIIADSRWVVVRKIPVLLQSIPRDEKDLDIVLSSLPGVISVSIDLGKSIVSIEYDVTHIQYKAVLDEIVKSGGSIKDGFWFRWKQGWIEFTETNMRDNAKAPPPACCNKPPK